MKLSDQKNQPQAAQSRPNEEMKNGLMLTKREKEVLELVMKGLTAQKIANEVFVSLNTVETHKRNIIQKLGAKNCTQAVVIALKNGWIE